jgi:hypothetical protein
MIRVSVCDIVTSPIELNVCVQTSTVYATEKKVVQGLSR